MYSRNEAILSENSNQLECLKPQWTEMPMFYFPEFCFSSKNKAEKVIY